MTDLYKILNVKQGASEEKFKSILYAYEVLSDREKRASYDVKFQHQSSQQEWNKSQQKDKGYKKSETQVKTKININYRIIFFIVVVILFYLFQVNKKRTTGNIKADRLLENEKTESRPNSGEIQFNNDEK